VAVRPPASIGGLGRAVVHLSRGPRSALRRRRLDQLVGHSVPGDPEAGVAEFLEGRDSVAAPRHGDGVVLDLAGADTCQPRMPRLAISHEKATLRKPSRLPRPYVLTTVFAAALRVTP
jgi:hypothetical protein